MNKEGEQNCNHAMFWDRCNYKPGTVYCAYCGLEKKEDEITTETVAYSSDYYENKDDE